MISIIHPSDKGKVVAMNRFRNSASLSPIRQVEAYWTALCDGGDIPTRSQIDPRGLEQVLEFAFILERMAPGVARFRLAGQHLCSLAGMEVRGMPLTAFFTPSSRERVGAVLEHVFDTPSVVELTLQGKKQTLRGACDGHMILLPLKSDVGDCSRILGVLVANGDFGRQPRRFEVTGTDLRDAKTAVPNPAESQNAVHGFAETQSVLGGRAPHLKLVK